MAKKQQHEKSTPELRLAFLERRVTRLEKHLTLPTIEDYEPIVEEIDDDDDDEE